MTAQKGALLLLKVGDGGTPTETFTTVAGMRSTRMILNQQLVDSTHKQSGAWRALLAEAGIRSISLTGNGIFTDSAAEETVRAIAFAGLINNFRLQFGNGDMLEGAFQITSYERAGDYDGEENFQLTLESAGTITFTTA